MRRSVMLLLAALAGVSCGAGGESGSFVGSLRVEEDDLSVDARCRDGDPTSVEIDGLVLDDDVAVELPFGDFASGSGRVEEVPSASLDDLRSAVDAYGFAWFVEVEDDSILTIHPWFIDGCVP